VLNIDPVTAREHDLAPEVPLNARLGLATLNRLRMVDLLATDRREQ
jgi:hypothetical protein